MSRIIGVKVDLPPSQSQYVVASMIVEEKAVILDGSVYTNLYREIVVGEEQLREAGFSKRMMIALANLQDELISAIKKIEEGKDES